METDYNKHKLIKNVIEKNFDIFWTRIFKVVEDYETNTGIKIKKDNKDDLKRLAEKIKKSENEIKDYCEEIRPDFDIELFEDKNDDRYEYQEFKDNIFAQVLWTVKGALRKASYDIEMEVYRENFLRTSAADIFVVVRNILKSTGEYITNSTDINYNMLKNIEQLNLSYLDQENMLLTGVIGLGIRSELLHRLYPGNFAIMTRRSLWGMYYLTNEEQEFVTDELSNDRRRHRTSHNWEYEYDRFMYYNNFIANLLENKLNKFGITMVSNLRFGYVNLFLNEIYNLNKEKIDFLFKWQYVEA